MRRQDRWLRGTAGIEDIEAPGSKRRSSVSTSRSCPCTVSGRACLSQSDRLLISVRSTSFLEKGFLDLLSLEGIFGGVDLVKSTPEVRFDTKDP